MPNMSFALTTAQVRARSKFVTRRLGWKTLTAGRLVHAVEKSQGLKNGETVTRLCALRVVDVRFEPLRKMTDDPHYGEQECRLEGFPHLTPRQFVTMFCLSHRGATPETVVTRIKFEYV